MSVVAGMVTRRDSPKGIEFMHQRGKVSYADMISADRFSRLLEATSSDGLHSIDYERQRVDDSHRGGVLPSALVAREQIKCIRVLVGEQGFKALCVAIVEEGGMDAVKEALNVRSKGTASKVLKAALAALTDFFNQPRM